MALNNYKILGQANTGSVLSLPVQTEGLTSSIASLTTNISHGAKIGDKVVVSGSTNSILNGNFLISSVSSSATFSYPRTSSNITPAATTSTTITVFSVPIGQAVTFKGKAGGIATLTVASTTGISAGDFIDVYLNDAAFDGTFIQVLEVPNSTQIRYARSGADVTTVAVSAGALSAHPATTLYTCPGNSEAIISNVSANVVNGIGVNGRFALYLVKSGDTGTPDRSRMIPFQDLYDGEIISITAGWTISAGDKLVMRALVPGLSVTACGTEMTI